MLSRKVRRPSTRFQSVVILVTALIYAGFAVWLGCDPAALASAFGVDHTTPELLTEFRAFYGGVEIGIAAACLILWLRREIFAAALIGGLPLLGSASGRLIGQFVDGFSSQHILLALPELVGGVLCIVVCTQTLGRRSKASD
jgi:hypothetical protein